MTDQTPAGEPPEARPTVHEYVVERALSDGQWVVDSISPAATAEQAEADAARWMRDEEDTYRTVRRTITSTVVSVRPGHPTSAS